MRFSTNLHHYFVPLLLTVAVQQLWAAAIIDPGSSRIVTNQIDPIAISDLNGTPIAGSLSLDFSFSSETFVRLFNEYTISPPFGPSQKIGTTPTFVISLGLQTSGSGLVGFLHGTGYITDHSGNRIPGYGVTGSSSSSDGKMSIGLFPLLRDDTGAPNLDLIRPLDFYGFHLDLTLPNAPALQVTGADLSFADSGGEFGIGPNIAFDIPEPSAFALAGLGAVALPLVCRRKRTFK